jgi:transposase
LALLGPFLPRPQRTGRPPADLREGLNAIFYLVRTGCPWRMLPKDFPPGSTVHTCYRRWRTDGTGERIDEARRQQVRRRAGRPPAPRSAAVDSQSVKTAGQGGAKGCDGGKKVSGRQRHIWVDSLGLLLAVTVTAADVPDGRAACARWHRRRWEERPRLEVVYADSQYRAGCLQEEVFAGAPFRLHVVSRRTPKALSACRSAGWRGGRSPGWGGRGGCPRTVSGGRSRVWP